MALDLSHTSSTSSSTALAMSLKIGGFPVELATFFCFRKYRRTSLLHGSCVRGRSAGWTFKDRDDGLVTGAWTGFCHDLKMDKELHDQCMHRHYQEHSINTGGRRPCWRNLPSFQFVAGVILVSPSGSSPLLFFFSVVSGRRRPAIVASAGVNWRLSLMLFPWLGYSCTVCGAALVGLVCWRYSAGSGSDLFSA